MSIGTRLAQALQVLLVPLARAAAARRARALQRLQEQARAVLLLARPRARQVVVLPPGVPLQLVQQQALLVRAGVVPQELAAVLPREVVLAALEPARTTGSRRSTGSSAKTERSTSKRRRAR
jgi:hypothetical protein